MKFKALYLPMLLSFCFVSTLYASDFEMETVPVAGRTFAGGPVVIDVSIRYTGAEPLRIGWRSGSGETGSIVDLHQGFGLSAPSGWKKRKVPSIQSSNILSSSDKLQPGEVSKKKLYLHYYFSEIPAGKVTLELSYVIYEPGGIGAKVIARPSTFVELEIREGSAAELSSFFKEMAGIARNSKQSYDRRLDACRQLIWVNHESAVKFLFEILQDEKLLPCHWETQSCLYAFSKKSKSILDALVSYLQESGTKNDSLYFFSLWKRDKVDIKWEFILKLLQSDRPWIRDRARETFGENASEAHQPNREPEPKVEKKEPHISRPERPEPAPERTNWLVPGLIIAVVVLAGVVVFLLLRGKRS